MTLLAPIYKFYFDRVAKRLARVGLQYHDAIAETGVYEKSLSRMSPEFQIARQRRMKRAQDLSSKHVDMPKELQEFPFKEYDAFQSVLSETQKEHDERKFLAKQWWMPYHLGRETWHSYDTKTAWFWQAPKPRKEIGTGPGMKKLA